ncbi:hypothetical protein BGZ63DRAFT_461971 [Mariannaea sp. PMI_226]|nr:hypothetical protein BGZ63DRAFT_461971 [Mariannaea sp. PMI_226]
MGLFSFLSRKQSSNQVSGLSLKGQAYESTVASQPPVRGTYPVAGNGTDIAADKLQQAARKRSLAQLPRAQNDYAQSVSAPSPSVPRFPSPFAGRPSSAPNNPRPTSRRLSWSRSLRGSSPASTLGPNHELGLDKSLPPVPPIPAQHRRRRQSSHASEHSNRFVDVLDAQGELRPSNFRSRVEASGARDYGEDVAERNLGENGSDLQSSAVQAFYSHPNHTDPRAVNKSPSAKTATTTHVNGDLPKRQRSDRKADMSTSLAKVSDASAWKPFSETSDGEQRASDYARGRRSERGRAKQRDLAHTNTLEAAQHPPVPDRRKSFHSLSSPHSKEKRRPRRLSLHSSFSSFNTGELLPPMPRSQKTNDELISTQRIGIPEVESVVEESFDDPAPTPNIPGRSKSMRRMSSSHSETHSEWEAHSRHGRPEKSYTSRPSSSGSVGPSRPRTRSIGKPSGDQQHRLDDITEHTPARTFSMGVQSQACFTPTTTTSGYSSNPFPGPGSQHTPTTSIDASFPASSEKVGHDGDRIINKSSNGGLHGLAYDAAPEDDYSLDIPVRRRDKDHHSTQLENDRYMAGNEFSAHTNDYVGFTDDSDVDSFVGVGGGPVNVGSGAGARAGAGAGIGIALGGQEHRPLEEGLLFDEGVYNGTGGSLPGLFDAGPMPSAPASLGRPKSTRSSVKSTKSVPRHYGDHPKSPSSHSKQYTRSHRRNESHGLTFNEADFTSFMALDDELLRKAGLMRIPKSENENNRRSRRTMYEYEDEKQERRADLRTAAARPRHDFRGFSSSPSTRSRQSRQVYRHKARVDDGNAADTED